LNNFLTTYSAVINMYFFFHRCSRGVWWTWWCIFITGVPEWNCLGQTAPEIWQSSSCHGCAPLPLDATTKRRDNSHEWSIKNEHSFTCNVTQLIFAMFGFCCYREHAQKKREKRVPYNWHFKQTKNKNWILNPWVKNRTFNLAWRYYLAPPINVRSHCNVFIVLQVFSRAPHWILSRSYKRFNITVGDYD
jgi:hypothetical protein